MGKSHQCEGTGRGPAGRAGLGLVSSRRGGLSRVSKAKMSDVRDTRSVGKRGQPEACTDSLSHVPFSLPTCTVTSGNSEDDSFSEFCESVYCLNLRVVLGASSHSC